jgi:hypothetical protein
LSVIFASTERFIKSRALRLFLLAGFDASAFASSGIDTEARKLYLELVKIGKWVIIFKGAIDIIKSLGEGDNAAAKKTFITSLLTFLILLGLPYGMDKIGEIFDSMSAATTTGGM